MLPAAHRLHRADDFRAAVRGRRAGSDLLVLHAASPAVGATTDPALVGLVVSRAVGGAVVRNRVKRRLRELVRERLSRLEPGGRYVVRAAPRSAHASYADLGRALDHCLDALGGRDAIRGDAG